MKKIITLILILITINLFGIKLYVSDAKCDYTEHNIIANIQHIDGLCYRLTGNFTNVPYSAYKTTIGIEAIAYKYRALVYSKSDTEIVFYSPYPINERSIPEFYIQVSKGHGISCRNHLIAELDGIVPDSNVYVGTIGLTADLLGVTKAFDIDIVSISRSGMSDKLNEDYGIPFAEAGKLIVYAHGYNGHTELNHTTYIGEIVTVSFTCNTWNNKGSYGKGLEFLYKEECTQSYSTPHIAGMFAKLHFITGKPYSEIRQTMRDVASFGSFWKLKEGYGIVDYNKTLSELNRLTLWEKFKLLFRRRK